MEKRTEKFIFLKASKSYDCLDKCIKAFEGILAEEGTSRASDYYYARNLLRDAKGFFQEALKEAKKLLGPMPEYVKADFEKWRAELLERDNILVKGKEIDELRNELLSDELLGKWSTHEEIDFFLEKHYQDQQKGQRKLTNIKVRILLDHLLNVISKADDLHKNALKKHQENI
jgi:hypothetical protein